MARQKVLTGARTADRMPALEENRHLDEATAEALAAPPTRRPGWYFRSPNRNLQVGLWATHDREINGERIRGSVRSLKFENGGAFVAAEDPDLSRIIRLVADHPAFEVSFFDEDKLRDQAEEARVKALIEQTRSILADPKLSERLRQQVDAQEFVMLEQAVAGQ